ncbi:MAG: tRNA (adenosine(37)-N6)-threonylcarbamoyltransferase complex transferase subunit TsaD [Clostridiales bacterium]|jgi:N6-L-threonylcarbamoyladenine synthase|nr:tRNA (adenosine(37)-N6)-threonylcarbamoyltransferase complex transferase subunit TsaD [Clostridiales bacterium]
MSKLRILGIESSCDETAASVVENGRTVLSNVIASQIDIHRRFGGVVPEIASRNHAMAVIQVVDEALTSAGIAADGIDAIAVANRPGLIGALLVGVSAAKALAYTLRKPLVAVSHTAAHVAGNYLTYPDLAPPFVCLLVSGGHTELLRVDGYTSSTVLGKTTDDACGEAFDKVARVLGLPYPGGPEIDRLAQTGNARIDFFKNAKPAGNADSLDFSYSGLKTAVISYLHNAKQRGEAVNAADVAASFARYAVQQPVAKALRACRMCGSTKLVLAGGVSANTQLREAMSAMCEREGIALYVPPVALCTDNAAVVASLGYYHLLAGEGIATLDLNAYAG